MADKRVDGFPGWAVAFLKSAGYRPGNSMDAHVKAWWSWYQVDNDFYLSERLDTSRGDSPERHLSLRPARMVSEEWASLVMDEKTAIASDDDQLNGWLDERFGDFVGTEADHLALAFALGTGAWSCDFGLTTDGETLEDATVSLSWHDAGEICPLLSDGESSVSCAFVDSVLVGGRVLDRMQVHEPVDETGGTYHVRTWLFDRRGHQAPVVVDSVLPDLDTGSTLPTYAIVKPAIANTYQDSTPLGVSVYDDGIDAIKCVDEAFDRSYWMMRLCQPRVILDESGLMRNPKTGDPMLTGTIDQKMFKPVKGGVSGGSPMTVYAPSLGADESDASINSALSLLSAKCGFGPNYFSYSRQQGLRTATEVSSDNSQLFRTVRKHEQSVGESLRRLFAGAYAAECALRGITPTSLDVDVRWDDSIVEDTATERATMKDDISRGLCPAWLYPVTYYGMSEDEARELVGAQVQTAQGYPQAVPEEA